MDYQLPGSPVKARWHTERNGTVQHIAEGYGRTKVCVFKPSFSHPLEQDGVVYLDIDGAVSEYTPISDGDGYTALDSKGREKMRSTIALYGNDACKHGNLWPCETCKAPGKEGGK